MDCHCHCYDIIYIYMHALGCMIVRIAWYYTLTEWGEGTHITHIIHISYIDNTHMCMWRRILETQRPRIDIHMHICIVCNTPVRQDRRIHSIVQGAQSAHSQSTDTAHMHGATAQNQRQLDTAASLLSHTTRRQSSALLANSYMQYIRITFRHIQARTYSHHKHTHTHTRH